jgi:hypothetical protein
MTIPQIQELCGFAYIADKEARSDLVGGFIVSEDDYTSNFTGALRRIINSNSRSGLTATSRRLEPSLEREIGCDAAVIISSPKQVKIATFEAKLPRLSQPLKPWDYTQTSTGLSHFSDQLDRQQAFTGMFAIFEMFYCDMPFQAQPSYMQPDVSSCVWHADAVQFDSTRGTSRAPWTDKELIQMLQRGNINIADILAAVCRCAAGKPIQMAQEDPEVIIREFHLTGHLLFIRAPATEERLASRKKPRS